MPTSERETLDAASVFGFLLTDYNPERWQHYFGDCPFTVRGGNILCPSPIGEQTVEDLRPRYSRFRYHGTGLHSALAAISMNMLSQNGEALGKAGQ